MTRTKPPAVGWRLIGAVWAVDACVCLAALWTVAR